MQEPSALKLRPATLDDAEHILRWRNDPHTRQVCWHEERVTHVDHLRWLRDALEDPHRLLLIAEHGATPCGVIRFGGCEPCERSACYVSVNLAPEWRGKGLGAEVIRLGTERALQRWSMVLADIKSGNVASRKAFAKAGYVVLADDARGVVMWKTRGE